MMRLSFCVDAPLIVPPAWLATEHRADWRGLVAVVVAFVASGASTNVVNDIFDRRKDAVTAPQLPLPSGLVTVAHAWITALLLALTFAVLVADASASPGALLLAAGVSALGAALIGVYSVVKPVWWLAPFVAASAFATVPLTAWIVGGADDLLLFALVLAYAALFALAGNLQAAVRDVDADASVGNHTIAVRLGPARTLALAATVDLASGGCVIAAASRSSASWVGLTTLGLGLVVLVPAYARAVDRQGDPGSRGRGGRVAAMRGPTFARLVLPVALTTAISVPLGVAVAATTAVALVCLVPSYERRIVRGDLRRAVEAARSPGTGALLTAARRPANLDAHARDLELG